ncbi:tail fiber protein; host specificity [Salmonella phage vB_SnwM_CGG4-1]|uniref:Receptor-recognizing protein gp38 n=1 Tax=Salmonella phage vB_SnwM_CGG4-1 TaxID=1815631 RepID=A0A1B0VVI5_9CAUD|nr:tail fiber protein; host specificity [Salmonella phage vB_SnwM_CGG4-1]ANA49592.1 long tail fiber adhesin [Salmonella phage vB_SnwM_CGG4-1]
MAVVGIPGNIGSSAKAETGQAWMSAAAVQLRLPGSDVWMSQFAGRSKEEIWEWGGANHSFNKDWLIGELRNRGGTPVVINIRADQVSYTPGVPLFEFPGDLPNAYITLNIYATIYGRGGNGSNGSSAGGGGGDCIHNWIGTRLRINNQGWICGGGGGGGGLQINGDPSQGGGGGRPFGLGGTNGYNLNGTNASILSPGAGYNNGYGDVAGNGGDVGNGGGGAHSESGFYQTAPAGGAGRAVVGTSPQWIATGSIAGSWL